MLRYFAYHATHGRDATLRLHIGVCLAILEVSMEELMELDESEVAWYLAHLPTLNMETLIMQAFNFASDAIAGF